MNEVVFHPKNDIPNFEECSINDWDERLIENCIYDLFIHPRQTIAKWALKTEQTAHLKIGYLGQYLASVLLNTKGCKTAARGNDCMDKSEVKSCSRIDQSDKCKRCRINIARVDKFCPKCKKNDKIQRNNDSKWLLTIRNEADLQKYLDLDRLVLIIEEYPSFHDQIFDTICIKVFEIYPKKNVGRHFKNIIESYFQQLYIANRKKTPNKIPAPKNLWPDSFQFYMCNPVKIFECNISNYLTDPKIEIKKYIKFDSPRCTSDIEKMPIKLLTAKEKAKFPILEKELTFNDILQLELRSF